MKPPILDPQIIRSAVDAALAEDLGERGDVTTRALVAESQAATARLVARAELVVAGLAVARGVFARLDPEVRFDPHVDDGDVVEQGRCVATVRGRARAARG